MVYLYIVLLLCRQVVADECTGQAPCCNRIAHCRYHQVLLSVLLRLFVSSFVRSSRICLHSTSLLYNVLCLLICAPQGHCRGTSRAGWRAVHSQ